MTTFFILEHIYCKYKNMLFSCSLQSSGSGFNKLVSGSTWTACSAYLEGTGDVISSINIQNQNFIGNNTSSDESYNISLKDNVTSALLTYIIYDTYSNVISWVNSQTGKSLQNLSYQKRPFVQI
jgi:hypothetical protein